jgi:hypothetical protein
VRRLTVLLVALFATLSSALGPAQAGDSTVTGNVTDGGQVSVNETGTGKPGSKNDNNGGGGTGSRVTCVGTPYGDIDGRSGTPGGATSFTHPDGSVWVVGNLTCSNGVTQGAYCVLNCPAGTADAPIPTPKPQDAVDAIEWPHVEARFSPELEKIRNGNIGGYLPGLYLFAAATPAAWALPARAEAAIGANWIRATAVPVRVAITVDGERTECPGPGRVVRTSEQYDEAKQSDTCKHLFTKAGNHPAAIAIVYHVTWVSNFPVDGARAGDLGEREGPATNYDLPVHEVQAVNR